MFLLGEPALVHLQHEAHRLLRAVRIGRSCGFMSARFTIRPSSATKAAVRGSRVFFIQKHCVGGLLEDEQHPFVLGHFLAEHQPVSRCSGVLRDLGVDLVHARRSAVARQIGLRFLGVRKSSNAADSASRARKRWNMGRLSGRRHKQECPRRRAWPIGLKLTSYSGEFSVMQPDQASQMRGERKSAPENAFAWQIEAD